MSDAGAMWVLLVEDSAADAELILHRLRELDPRELLSTRALEERRHVVATQVRRPQRPPGGRRGTVALARARARLGVSGRIRAATDDFGTGYSSLNYLSRLPADEIEIDRSFVAAMTTSPESLALVTNIINLAHTLNLKVVAESVEEEEQAKLLRLLRCDLLQGFLLGRPVAVDEFEHLHLDG